MVSSRCKTEVKTVLVKHGLHWTELKLGEVNIKENMTDEQLEIIKKELFRSGFELMVDKNAQLVERIKNAIIEMIHYSDEPQKINSSLYLSEKLKHDYTYLANLFSEATGFTIEHYVIAHKIERVKELLLYDELTLTEISYRLNYSSVAHLSSQFKKVTGLTPMFFKNLRTNIPDLPGSV